MANYDKDMHQSYRDLKRVLGLRNRLAFRGNYLILLSH